MLLSHPQVGVGVRVGAPDGEAEALRSSLPVSVPEKRWLEIRTLFPKR